MKDIDGLKRILHEAIVRAITEIGMDEFKKCSFFPLSNAKRERAA